MDDIRHMEEMEQERLAKEAEEAERNSKLEKVKEQFDVPEGQWKIDKENIQDLAEAHKNKEAAGGDPRAG